MHNVSYHRAEIENLRFNHSIAPCYRYIKNWSAINIPCWQFQRVKALFTWFQRKVRYICCVCEPRAQIFVILPQKETVCVQLCTNAHFRQVDIFRWSIVLLGNEINQRANRVRDWMQSFIKTTNPKTNVRKWLRRHHINGLQSKQPKPIFNPCAYLLGYYIYWTY